MKKKLKGWLIGGVFGLIFGLSISLINIIREFFIKIIGNRLYIIISQGGGISGFYRFTFYITLACILIGGLFGYLLNKLKNEK